MHVPGLSFLFLLLLGTLALAAGAPEQAQRGYYTAERLAVMRENLQKHEWARKEADAILARATRWLAYDDERLRLLVPPPPVPPAFRVNPSDCPVHGRE